MKDNEDEEAVLGRSEHPELSVDHLVSIQCPLSRC
jgi:hypothetical protein